MKTTTTYTITIPDAGFYTTLLKTQDKELFSRTLMVISELACLGWIEDFSVEQLVD